MGTVRRIYVEKKKGYDVYARGLFADLKENLGIKNLKGVRVVNRYDIEGISEKEYKNARTTIFAEPPVDSVYDEKVPFTENEKLFAIEYLPGQYDQRADSAAQCIQIITHGNRPLISAAQVIILEGTISEADFETIKKYCINPVDSREASLEKPSTLDMKSDDPPDVAVLEDFIKMDDAGLEQLLNSLGLAMRIEDLKFCRDYFKNTEYRDPTITEIRMLDTYWSDHCRHTTFLTRINNVNIDNNNLSSAIISAFEDYKEARKSVYGDSPKEMCLMDVATIGMKLLRKNGLLNDLDVSDEVNACSIVVPVKTDTGTEEWLVMFKNETHNHPTEIEPFGGAATCLGGAIRDPLSGRSYVYQAMRVTGSGDPRKKIEETIPGKLPQRKITTLAAHGYISYGNQIGLATGHVAEVYDEGFAAKRMEIGAVIGAAPRANIVREEPREGDIIVLLGGRTGRDGCGGATGSSKAHTEESILTCGAEVQKGNPPTERKIQRLFRNAEVSRLIKRCNDFGAGGVSVAIGELAPGLDIDLDAVPKKYEGLDGTELAISESQERMAVVITPSDLDSFVKHASLENLETAVVARVTDNRRLRMKWRGKIIVDLSRDFIDTNGVRQETDVDVTAPDPSGNYFNTSIPSNNCCKNIEESWFSMFGDLNVCSQKGLVERFDSTIGASTVLMPFGGKFQDTPAECMVAKIPVLKGDTSTGTAMSYGYNPALSSWSPFHGAVFAIVESVAKIVAVGGDHHGIRLTLQEYFERVGRDPKRWGKPFAALMGAFWAQKKLGIPAIGGKDSMSGSFKDLNVPPTLVSFAAASLDVKNVISPEFKKSGSNVVLVTLVRNNNELPDFELLDKSYSLVTKAIHGGNVLAAHTVRAGGIAEALGKMCFGNRIGVSIDNINGSSLFTPDIGSIILELASGADPEKLFNEIQFRTIGVTTERPFVKVNGTETALPALLEKWKKPLEKIFPSSSLYTDSVCMATDSHFSNSHRKASVKIAHPRVLITVFPGTNCEYDSVRAFEKAGAVCDVFVMRNLNASDVEESINSMVLKVNQAQIIMVPGGFSAGDEPDGSGKFIAAFFRNPHVKDSVNDFLGKRDGLMLGICNGFQALIKLGLVPWGEIRDIDDNSPTLTFNTIGRHVSRMAYTRICSASSPWFENVNAGDIHAIPVSHGEGRFVAPLKMIEDLFKNGQIATQYVDCDDKLTGEMSGNPNGSYYAIEGITSPDGRVLGKMGHSERKGTNVAKNIYGLKDQYLFEAGVKYFS